MIFLIRCITAGAIAIYLSYSGYKKKSLSVSGSIGAFVVGFLTFSASYRFGIILITFYYSGSKFTKLQESVKLTYEDGYLSGGQRNIIQVFVNSILATIVAITYLVYIGEDADIFFSNESSMEELMNIYPMSKLKLGSLLWCAFLGHYACAAGDTWSSELGILSKCPPRLITKFFLVQVPPGTNGGVSLLGFLASAAGGMFIGLIFYVSKFIFISSESKFAQYPVIFLCLLCGLVGSLLDSIIGGLFQASYYSKDNKKIVKSHNRINDKSIVIISGYDLLSNDGVNFISIAITMIFSILISPKLFCFFDKSQC